MIYTISTTGEILNNSEFPSHRLGVAKRSGAENHENTSEIIVRNENYSSMKISWRSKTNFKIKTIKIMKKWASNWKQ